MPRIDLHFSDWTGGNSLESVDVETATDLIAEMQRRDVRRFARGGLDVTDSWKVHGPLRPVADLTDEDLAWAAEPSEFESRHLSCERPIQFNK